jgi:RNA-directed DNA polymerase
VGGVRSWRLHCKTTVGFAELAKWVNPIIRGWMQYYGAFCRSELFSLLRRINAYLVRWIRKKFKRLRPIKKAMAAWQRITSQYPKGFAHWAWLTSFW